MRNTVDSDILLAWKESWILLGFDKIFKKVSTTYSELHTDFKSQFSWRYGDEKSSTFHKTSQPFRGPVQSSFIFS